MRILRTLLSSLGLLLFALPALAASPGDRIKLACQAGAGVSDPCRAVYYWGADGKRHAFPNEDIYYSWFGGFTDVRTVDAAQMAGLMLGKNVGYRPGSRLVKFQTEPRTYAIDADGTLRWVASEAAAKSLYGENWSKIVRDLDDTLASGYRYGALVNSVADLDVVKLLDTPMTPDTEIGATYSLGPVATTRGSFDSHVVTLDRARFRMQTLVAATADCYDNCAARSLSDHAKLVGAFIGMNGSYFCPPDYPACNGKTYTFLPPAFDTPSGLMRNSGAIPLHQGPMIASSKKGDLVFYRMTPSFGSVYSFESTYGSPLEAAIANYPSLVDGGMAVAEGDPRLEEPMKSKATRGGIGFSDKKIFLVNAKNATVPDLAEVMIALGATYAMNLDGGGSSAILYGGAYKVGPGRLLPNAIVFTER